MNELPLAVRVRLVVKGLTPPFLWALLKALKERRRRSSERLPEREAELETPVATAPPEWEYVPEGWARPAGGWDVGTVAQAYRAKWPAFVAAVEGPGPLGVNHEVPVGRSVTRDDRDAEHVVLAFAYALALAAHDDRPLSLLDWGGGPGHYAVLARRLLPGVELDYHSRDLPTLVALGRELLPSDSFHDDDGCLDRRYDLVVASSSLHYVEDWRALLERLADAADGYLYVTRVPVALGCDSFVVLQRAHAYGYETEYLGWVLNRTQLVAAAGSAGVELVREFVLPAWFTAEGAPETPVEHRGYLFARSVQR